jgi:hypothetical protein
LHSKALQIFPNWDFWYENIPSGNPGQRFGAGILSSAFVLPKRSLDFSGKLPARSKQKASSSYLRKKSAANFFERKKVFAEGKNMENGLLLFHEK